MKGIVVYYSGSGNTKKVANAIHRGMKKVIDSDIASVKEIDPKEMAKYDLVGIGFPIWFFRETANVRLFVYNMPDMTGKLGFIFCSHGGTPSGAYHSILPVIKRRNLTLIGWNDWYASPHYTLHMAKPSGSDGHPDEIDKQEAEDFGREMAERAQRIYAGEKDLIPEIPHGPQADPLFHPHGKMMYFPGARIPDRKINLQKCKYPECTLCVDNCAAHAIDFSVTPPVFKKTCLNCCLCDRMCPEEAIEIPPEQMARMKSLKRINMEKCKYPECTVCVDHCAMNSIDFSVNPPVIKNNCEGDDLCWVICPQGAIEIINLETTHRAMLREMAKQPPEEAHDFLKIMEAAKASGRFRQLVPDEEIGKEGMIMDMKRLPRFNIDDLMNDDYQDYPG